MARASSSDVVPSTNELRWYRTFSTVLNNVMNDIGASLRVRKTKAETATSSEILQTIAYHPLRVYIFGSWFEGTSTAGLHADIDNSIISPCFPVVTETTGCPRPVSYLLIPDKQPGYAKLQLLFEGKPKFKGFVHHIPDSLYDLCVDKNKRLCLMQNYENSDILLGAREMKGPALHHNGHGIKCPTDTVYAVWCKTWPKCASKWLTRRRRHGWPTNETIRKCKSLGFLMVQACHPRGVDKKCQWRISFSEQERLLVTKFNDTQYKCYVLLKIFKKEVIEEQIGEDTLTTYHCKTCMFYLIENTPSELWSFEHLISCFLMCLRQILLWVKKNNCPNYFIPGENMFDRIIGREWKIELSKLLKSVLHSDIRNVINSLKTDCISLRLAVDLNPSWNMLILSSENISCIASMNILLSDLVQARNNILVHFVHRNRHQPRRKNNLCEYMNHLHTVLQIAGAKQITNHTEQETLAASSLIIPFIKLTLLSCNVVKHMRETAEIVKQFLNKTEWDTLYPINSSAKVKQAAAMHMLKYEASSIAQLMSIAIANYSYCSCKCFPLEIPNAKALSRESEHRPDITPIELFNDYLQPCIVFLPFEEAITPKALHFEMIRTYAMPPLTGNAEYQWWYRWGVVDGRFLVHFLLYLNHRELRKTVQCAQDIKEMTMLLTSNNVCHKETCFNLLGWVYKEHGDVTKAVQYFIKSLQTNSLRNAAYWHLCFHICERINRRKAISTRRIYGIFANKIKEIGMFVPCDAFIAAIGVVLFFAVVALQYWNALN